MNTILVVGETYCGKGFFISKLEKIFHDIKVIHTGDLIRKLIENGKLKNTNNPTISGTTISNIISNELKSILSNKKPAILVLDNPIKNVDQANNVFEMLKSFNIKNKDITTLWITNKRENFDYKSRNRKDDNMIPKKMALWKTESDALRQYLEKNNINIIDIQNTDKGILF